MLPIELYHIFEGEDKDDNDNRSTNNNQAITKPSAGLTNTTNCNSTDTRGGGEGG